MPLDSLSSIDSCIDFTLPYYDQDQWFNSDMSVIDHVLSTHGSTRFYHKSFYGFLHDPAHSGAFYVNTPVIYWHCNLLQIPRSFDSTSPLLCIKLCYWWPKHVFPSLYLLLNLPVILELVLAPGYRRLFCLTLLAAWNWVFWFLSRAGDLFYPLILLIPWWSRLLSILRGCPVRNLAAAGRRWLSQVFDSEPDMVGVP